MNNSINPFDGKLLKTKQKLSVAEQERKNIESHIEWYKSFDMIMNSENLSSDKANLSRENQNVEAIEFAINDQLAIVERDKKKTPWRFDPRQLFNSELRQAARTYASSLEKLKRIEKKQKRTPTCD